MDKKTALRRWLSLKPNLPILPHFTPIAADARGSTFGACGIRISGNPDFVDAVLSRLKDLIDAEGGSTRLSLSRNSVRPVFEKKWGNADTDAETCYIQVRERTACTRQRKVRSLSDELPTADSDAVKTSYTPKSIQDELSDLMPSCQHNPKATDTRTTIPITVNTESEHERRELSGMLFDLP